MEELYQGNLYVAVYNDGGEDFQTDVYRDGDNETHTPYRLLVSLRGDLACEVRDELITAENAHDSEEDQREAIDAVLSPFSGLR